MISHLFAVFQASNAYRSLNQRYRGLNGKILKYIKFLRHQNGDDMTTSQITRVRVAGTGPNSRFDISVVEDYLKSKGTTGANIDEIITATDATQHRSVLARGLEQTMNAVMIGGGYYIHRANIVDLEDAAQTLLDNLKKQFGYFDGFSNSAMLYDAAQIDLTLFMNDNGFEDEDKIYFLAKHLFSKEKFDGNEFLFQKCYIFESRPDYPMTLNGLLVNQARKNGGIISRDEGEAYLERIRMSPQNFRQAVANPQDTAFYQYADGVYILSETLGINREREEQIRVVLTAALSDHSYVIPHTLNEIFYRSLPSLDRIEWTLLLLQEVVRHDQNIGYKFVFAPLSQQRLDTIGSAIVPFKSELTFADIVFDHLKSKLSLPARMNAEELRGLIREAGMLEGNEMISNMHKALPDPRFAFSDGNKTVFITEV
jgi:hypothetical protein